MLEKKVSYFSAKNPSGQVYQYDIAKTNILWQEMPIICNKKCLPFSYRVIVRRICIDLARLNINS